MSVNALLYEREQEPEFFARKCRRCHEPETRCECEDDERDREDGDELFDFAVGNGWE